MWQPAREVQARIERKPVLNHDRREWRQGDGQAVYQYRDMMTESGGAAAMPRGFGRLVPAIVPVARERFSLVVDLSAEPLSATWWRGAATLALLSGIAGVLAVAVVHAFAAGTALTSVQYRQPAAVWVKRLRPCWPVPVLL